ncbi:hypothetical protein PHMEG_00015829 [Phytophthora megakarya]|uniref:Integrase catalytic domain-containing protein n=1 Tax=Phytophthora megakarya TaxID=4795 RepID=A0A225W2E7_9STRA|nr:hypothetical protein PHMEG_00015829 [Phytophthora megakarya]
MVPTVIESRTGKPVGVRLTNVSEGTARCYKYSSVILWIPTGELPREVGYFRLNASEYNEWQVLAYAKRRDDTFLQKEKELYECWLAEQPPVVERQAYSTPSRILTRPTEDSVALRKSVTGHPVSDDRDDGVSSHNSVTMHDESEASVAARVDETTSGETNVQPTEFSDAGNDEIDPAEDLIEAEIAADDSSDDDDWYEHIPNEMELADYAHELVFLPDLTEPSSTVLDYTGPNVMNKSLGEDEQRKLIEVLQRQEEIMIASGNALPPPVYGVSRVDFLSQEVVPEGLRSDAKKIKRVTEFSFPTSKKGMQSFLGALNYYSRFIQDFAVYATALYQLKEEDVEPGGDLSVARQSFARLQQKIGDAPILCHFDRQKEIHVTLFANEDLRFMSEVFQSFTEMMQSRSRATLSYRPQANGQQERSVKIVMQSVCVYAEDPLQQDWDEIAKKLIFVVNNSMDTTRKKTPFFLVHGWDAQSTLKAMSSSLKPGLGRLSDALA